VLERPDVDDAALSGYLRRGWGVEASTIEFMPVGNDSHAWAFDLRTGPGERYFLKLRRGPVKPAGVRVPHYLRQHGLGNVVAAVPTVDGTLAYEAGEDRILLYPFVAAQPAHRRGMTEAQWVEYGAFLRDLHAVGVPEELAAVVPEETFTPVGMGTMRWLADRVAADRSDEPLRRALVACWHAHAEEIAFVMRRTEELAGLAAAQGLPHVLCHADIHTANVLVDDLGRMSIVDWDETVRAPRERDLMFILGANIAAEVTAEQEALFLQGYGDHVVNWPALAFYRYDWAVQDLSDFGHRVFARDDLGTDSKAHALDLFCAQFEPSGEVDIAMRAEEHL
jgi:spectinomycin phosphotransferase